MEGNNKDTGKEKETAVKKKKKNFFKSKSNSIEYP